MIGKIILICSMQLIMYIIKHFMPLLLHIKYSLLSSLQNTTPTPASRGGLHIITHAFFAAPSETHYPMSGCANSAKEDKPVTSFMITTKTVQNTSPVTAQSRYTTTADESGTGRFRFTCPKCSRLCHICCRENASLRCQ